MLQHRLREPVAVIINPLCKGLIRMGVKANALTVVGALGVSFSALYFYGRGSFVVGTIFVTLFALLDLLDGTVARLSGSHSSKWGALLDSTLDRISDAMILTGILIFFVSIADPNIYLCISVMVTSGLVSYIRARAEGLKIECSAGIAERTERLIVILAGAALFGFGINIALVASLWLALVLTLITVAQRLVVVFRA